jgi:hypothetical protein
LKVPDAVGVPLIVMVLAAHDALTPAGNPVEVPIPVAPVVVCVIAVNAVFMQSVGVEDAALTVLFGVTEIVPVAVTVPQPPVKVTVYVNAPDTVGVPLIVTTFDAQPPVTPVGNPVIVAPVAPVEA